METATLYYEPNETTIVAIEEARSGKELDFLRHENKRTCFFEDIRTREHVFLRQKYL